MEWEQGSIYKIKDVGLFAFFNKKQIIPHYHGYGYLDPNEYVLLLETTTEENNLNLDLTNIILKMIYKNQIIYIVYDKQARATIENKFEKIV